MGLFLLVTTAFQKGRLVARTAHSAYSLRINMLASLAHSVYRLAQSLHSLPHGTIEILKCVHQTEPLTLLTIFDISLLWMDQF